MTQPWSDVHAALFDWDGTLVDTGDVLLSCWHRVTREVLGYAFPTTEEDRRRYLAMRAADSFPLLSDDPATVRALATGFDTAYAEVAPAHVREHPGARDLLDDLRAAGIPVAVVTSKTARRYRIDARLSGIEVGLVRTGDDVTRGKPDPEGIHQALAELGIPAHAAVYVGDSPVDVRAGRAAGLRTIGLTHGLHSRQELVDEAPDALVEDLREVAALLIPRPQTSGQSAPVG